MSYLFTYNTLEWVIRIAMVPVILRRRLTPSVSLAWLATIFFLPLVGVVIYLLIGDARLGKRRVTSYARVGSLTRTAARMAVIDSKKRRPDLGEELMPVVLQAERISGNPIIGGNHVELLADTDGTIDRLVADIDAAQHHAHLMYYIFRADSLGCRVCDAVERAAKRGVTVRLLADAVASRAFLRGSRAGQLQQAGVQVRPSLPVAPFRRPLHRLDLRNHRKLAVVDGRIALAGSQNVVNADYGHKKAGAWIDLSAQFTGPVVHQFQLTFLNDWTFETDEEPVGDDLFPDLQPAGDVAAQCVPTGPTHDGESFRRVLLTALGAARRKIIITSPYLVPDEPTLLALTMAVDRGVSVGIVLPQRSDHPLVDAAGRACFEELLDAGVILYRYKPGMLHAKTLTVDDAFAVIGSANMDIRSFDLNFELNALLYGREVTSLLRFAQQTYINDSVQLTREAWRNRSRLQQYVDGAAALLSPLL
jgi:cardiolipin synthase